MGIHGKPAWLEALYKEKFFTGCTTHESSKKNEKNICCLDCCSSICPHCVPSHRFHRLVQIRRYVYHDVVRLEDLEKLIDCSNVQSYTINSAKVVFIKKRPQSRQFKGSGNFCISCDRSLQEPYIHCSLGCKVDFVLKHKKNLSSYLRACNSLQLGPDFLIPTHEDNGGSGGDYEMMMMMNEQEDTPHSTIVDNDEPMMSYSSSGSGSENNMDMSSMMVCRDFVRKKRSSGGCTGTSGGLYVCGRSASSRVSISNHHHHEDMATSMNNAAARRKGIPHRSPLC